MIISHVFRISEIQLNSIYLPVRVQINNAGTAIATLNRWHQQRPQTCINKVNYVARMALTLLVAGFRIVSSSIISTWFFFSRLKKMRVWQKNGCQQDIDLLSTHEQRVISQKIYKDLDERMPSATPEMRQSAYKQILSYYARSGKIYGPIVRLWVDHVLAKAHQSNSSIIFLARDGIAPYKVATHLLKTHQAYREKYPNLCKENGISLAFLSRKVIKFLDKNQNLGSEYLQQLLPQDILSTNHAPDTPTQLKNVMFVDIGFAGSMISRIKNLMNQATSINFENRCTFHYLISHTDKAEGFLGQVTQPFDEVASAGTNPAVNWLEDSHQTSISSPTTLVKDSEGKIYPNTQTPSQTIEVSQDPLQYLLRKYATAAAIDFASQEPDPSTISNKAQTIIKIFRTTLSKIKNAELPIFI